jgi:hypothetical protein
MSNESRPKSIRFIHPIEDPHKPQTTLREEQVPVLRQGTPHAFTVVEENGWLKITGKHRTVKTPKINAISVIDEDSAVSEKKAGSK